MNAVIRAVVRAGLAQDWEVVGIRCGFRGLIDGDIVPLGARNVGGIIQQGGTVLGSTRCPEFKIEAGQRRALDRLHQHQLSGLVVIGGNGSQTGAHALAQLDFPVVAESMAARR